MTTPETLDLTRMDAPLGAEITGLDLTEKASDAIVAALLQAWFDHQVLVVRDQELTPQQLVDFTAQLGEPGVRACRPRRCGTSSPICRRRS